MDVGIRNRDIPGAGEGDPVWLDPAHDEPIDDEQVNEVEDEKNAEGVGEEFPRGVATSQGSGSPKQCGRKGSPEEQSEQDGRPPLFPRFGWDDLSDLLGIVA